MQGQTIGKKVIENGRKRNDARTSVDGADWKSLFRSCLLYTSRCVEETGYRK